ncbi:MAG TPA: hypothetical protein VE621_15680 [Bryobacteraceae bacterium]|nr:hypothetical protein [Bryobacteraceae bacterium]
MRLLAALLLFASFGLGNTIVSVSTTASNYNAPDWRPATWSASQPTNPNNSTPYFSVPSDDGSGCNIGYFIAGTATGSCQNQMANPPFTGHGAALEYWGKGKINGSGATNVVDTGFYFTADNSTFVIQVLAEVAGNRNLNEIGLYFRDGTTAALRLLSGPENPPQSFTFTPGAAGVGGFGIYLKNAAGDIYYSESSRNAVDAGRQHFAVFRDRNVAGYAYNTNNWTKLWIGAEDNHTVGTTTADYDFNDAIITIACTAGCTSAPPTGLPELYTPEPGTFVLMGCSLVALFLMIRRSRKPESTTWG